jgi:hypothetical protein
LCSVFVFRTTIASRRLDSVIVLALITNVPADGRRIFPLMFVNPSWDSSHSMAKQNLGTLSKLFHFIGRVSDGFLS